MMNYTMKLFLLLVALVCSTGPTVWGQEVCFFENLRADCRYHIHVDRAQCLFRGNCGCLSHIVAVVDPCADPVDVTFSITCKNRNVNFKHTFKSSDTLVTVPGFVSLVVLRVRLMMKEKDLMNVEADFVVQGVDKTDYINSDIDLKGQIDICPNLNTAAKIAVGIMGVLAGLVVILIGVLMYERYRR